MTAFCVFLVLFSLIQLTSMRSIDKIEAERVLRLRQLTEARTEPGGVESAFLPQAEPQVKPILAGLRELYARNDHLIGWVDVAGTGISYPVVRHPTDADFYLAHDFDKNENKNGVPFLDSQCEPDSGILLIHGHNMKSGLMFAGLEGFKDGHFFAQHHNIQLSGLYECREYEIVAVLLSKVYMKSDKDFKYYDLSGTDTPEGFRDYWEGIQRNAFLKTEAEAVFGDSLLILSTCSYHIKDGRLAVVARRVK